MTQGIVLGQYYMYQDVYRNVGMNLMFVYTLIYFAFQHVHI